MQVTNSCSHLGYSNYFSRQLKVIKPERKNGVPAKKIYRKKRNL